MSRWKSITNCEAGGEEFELCQKKSAHVGAVISENPDGTDI